MTCRSATPRHLSRWIVYAVAALTSVGFAPNAVASTFESGQVRPLALSANGGRLFAVNTPDARLEVFDVGAEGGGLRHVASVPVGLDPVAVAVRNEREVWVVNHLSDSLSLVDVGVSPPRVVRTLLVGDEPRDIVFAGPARARAFVTTAHRGQNRPGDPQLTTPGVGRADVWVFDADNLGAALGGTPLTLVTLFADTPRALAVSPNGATVYAAGFHTGNRTAALHDGLVCDGGAVAPPCTVSGHSMPGGLPLPDANADQVRAPEVGLIVQFDGTDWRDPIGRQWNSAVRFSLPDNDLFAIDAMADPPTQSAAVAGVGTILFNLAVHPVNGRIYVTNTEARNLTRFEGPGVFGGSTVRGHLHEARISVLTPTGDVMHRPLNTHIDYDVVPSPPGTSERSLATPSAMAITEDGAQLYVAASGSSKVAVFDTAELDAGTFSPSVANQIPVSGGGPGGLALDEARQRLYVLTRFDNAVVVIDTAARQQIARVPLYNPEPPAVVDGRRFLYDAALTSSNGEASCAACHVFGDFDSLAWDLGDPEGSVLENRNPRRAGLSISPDFHPMKGPMTTQTLRGLAGQGPMHWRGDRTGGLPVPSVEPDGGAFDEVAAFMAFNGAFAGLLGRAEPLSAAEMAAFTAFALAIRSPPNPIRQLDNSLTEDQAAGRTFYFESIPSDVSGACNFCHVLDLGLGLFGTDGRSVIEPQGAFKIPHLRNAYQKIGMFGMPHVPSMIPGFGFNATDHVATGDQVRGVGFTHDGSVDTVFRFLQRQGFNRTSGNPGGFTVDAVGDGQRRQVEAFVLAFDGEFAPIVGQQVSVVPSAASDPSVLARVGLMAARAAEGECDLVTHGLQGGVTRGWLYEPQTATFRADREGDPALSMSALMAHGMIVGQERTFTCVPPGTGGRAALDRDGDGFRDRDELDAGSDPADSKRTPRDADRVVPIDGGALSLWDDSAPPTDLARRRIRFQVPGRHRRMRQVTVPPAASPGDPTRPGSNGGGVVRVYNAAGSGETVTVGLPAANWRRLGSAKRPRGYRYAEPRGGAGPIERLVVLRSGRVALRGGGPGWAYTLDEPAQGAIAVRVQLGRGDVWCAAFPAQPRRRPPADRIDRFVGQRHPPAPASCPPLP